MSSDADRIIRFADQCLDDGVSLTPYETREVFHAITNRSRAMIESCGHDDPNPVKVEALECRECGALRPIGSKLWRELHPGALPPATVERVMELIEDYVNWLGVHPDSPIWEKALEEAPKVRLQIRRILSGDHIPDAGKKVVSDE